MADDKVIRCDCGYRLRGRDEQGQVAEVRRHAWEAHAISFSSDEALAVLLRIELAGGVPTELPIVEDTKRRRETQ